MCYLSSQLLYLLIIFCILRMKSGLMILKLMRSPTGKYRTTPLGGLFTRAKGGYYHDGRFATLSDVIDHYNTHMNLNLNSTEIQDLTEYLKSF